MEGSRQPSAANLLRALSEVLAQSAEPVKVLRTILEQAVAETGADRGVFVEVQGRDAFSYRVLHRFERQELVSEAGRFSRSIFAEVLQRGEGILLPNAMSDTRFTRSRSVQQLRLTSILCMPVRAEGRIVALVHLESGRTSHFAPEHLQLLASMLEVAGPALEALRAGDRVMQERDEAREDLSREWSFSRFVGRSAAVKDLAERVRKAAATAFPVLLMGETGTGKGILARIIHHTGARCRRPFLTVFCPSLERGMVESELFGARRGAFTGAVADRAGKIQGAEKGTLFLDEIGDLPLEIQPKLLRLLQEKTYEKVGDPQERHADVRVIAATNRDLDLEVAERRFRRDLFERLNYIPIRVPPLRERREDIPALLTHCLARHESGRWIEVSREALDHLVRSEFSWPGNVRHIEQLAARLAAEGMRGTVSVEDVRRLIPESSDRASGPDRGGASSRDGSLEAGLPALLERAERSWLEEAVRRHPDLTRAQLAEKLKISESALYKKLKAYGL